MSNTVRKSGITRRRLLVSAGIATAWGIFSGAGLAQVPKVADEDLGVGSIQVRASDLAVPVRLDCIGPVELVSRGV